MLLHTRSAFARRQHITVGRTQLVLTDTTCTEQVPLLTHPLSDFMVLASL